MDVVGDQVGGVVEKPADHDHEDEDEDQHPLPVRGFAVAALGTADPEQPRGVDDDPAPEHVGDPDDDSRLEQVASDEERRAEWPVGRESGDVPARVECPREQRDHLEHEHDEAPEDERVHDARRLLTDEELLLAKPVDDGLPDALRDAVEARRRSGGRQQAGARDDDRAEDEQPNPQEDRKNEVTHTRTPESSSRR